MDVRNMVKNYLESKGIDGLYSSENDCGCETSDLMPCKNSGIENCVVGKKHYCKDCDSDIKENCECDIDKDRDSSWCIKGI